MGAKGQANPREGYSAKTPLDTAIDQSEKTTSLTKKSPGNKNKSDHRLPLNSHDNIVAKDIIK